MSKLNINCEYDNQMHCLGCNVLFTFCFYRFVAYDVDMFGEPNFIGQYTIPVRCIRSGYRSVHLKNTYSEDMELGGNNFKKQLTSGMKCIIVRYCSLLHGDFKT